MSRVYSSRLAGPTDTQGVLFTVPTGHTYVVKTITITLNGASAGIIVGFRINGTGSGQMVWRQAVPGDTTTIINFHLALAEGDQLRWITGTLGSVAAAVVVSGFDLIN